MRKYFALALLASIAFVFGGSSLLAESRGRLTLDSMVQMDQYDLDDLYYNALPGPMPRGASDGRAMFFSGSIINAPATLLASIIWQGKVFDTNNGILVNRVFGFRAIKAELSFGQSLFDGNDAIIIDYANTSIVAHSVRDEIRMVAPHLYLGRAYIRTLLGPWMAVNFALEFPH